MTEAEANALQKQIDELGERMEKKIDELKDFLESNENRIRKLETDEAGCLPLTNTRLTAVETLLRAHDDQILALTKSVQALELTNKILSWIGGLAGGAIILWFIGQITGMIGR